MRIKKKQYWKIALAGFLFLAVVAIAVILNERAVAGQHENTDASYSLIARDIQENDHVIGDRNAPIKIIVYSDLSCIYCKVFDETYMPKIQKDFGASVVFVYRHLPLAIHPKARLEAIASECVSAQKGDAGFWKFRDDIYAVPTYQEGLSAEKLRALAVSLGVKSSAYDSCMTDPATAAHVDKDTLEGSVAGLTMVPSVILKSQHRALTVVGGYQNQIYSGISYLRDAEKQIQATQK